MPYGISTEPPICTSPRPLHRGILQKSPMWQIPCGLIICSSNCHLSWGELGFCPHSLRRILPYIPVRPDIRCKLEIPHTSSPATFLSDQRVKMANTKLWSNEGRISCLALQQSKCQSLDKRERKGWNRNKTDYLDTRAKGKKLISQQKGVWNPPGGEEDQILGLIQVELSTNHRVVRKDWCFKNPLDIQLYRDGETFRVHFEHTPFLYDEVSWDFH